MASGQILCPTIPRYRYPFLLHPVALDVAFQTAPAAMGVPNDGALWTLQVPTKVTRIRINPFALLPNGGLGVELSFDFGLTPPQDFQVFGDVDAYDKGCGRAMVQVKGLHVTPRMPQQKPVITRCLHGLFGTRHKYGSHQRRVLDWAADTVSSTLEGTHPHLKKEWLDDILKDLTSEALRYVLNESWCVLILMLMRRYLVSSTTCRNRLGQVCGR